MDFRTILPALESPFQINYQDRLLTLGSCFAEHIGGRLTDLKFIANLNPFGILYNPVSILQALELLHADRWIEIGELFQQQDLWHHFAFHGRFSAPDREKALAGMNTSLRNVRQNLTQTNRLLLTWGTAFAYRHREKDEIVGNCHKVPSSVFERFRLQPEQFLPTYRNLLSTWKTQQPDLEVMLTVSPVRHLRDGMIENQRSKAVLLLAAEELTQSLDFVHYFPAYELVMDDLRDYRFFDPDMAHPNELAVNYVWDYFKKACFSPTTKKICQEIEPIIRAGRHRPFHPDTAAYRAFCVQQLTKIEKLEELYGFLDFSREREEFGRSV